jgi:hypothetical protein
MKLFHLFKVPVSRILALLLSMLLAVWIGFALFDLEQAIRFIGVYGYWFVAIPFALLCLEYVSCYWHKWMSRSCPSIDHLRSLSGKEKLRAVFGTYGLPALFVFIVSGLLLASQPSCFKVVMDEPIILSTSMQMHQTKQAYAVLEAYEIGGVRYSVNQIVDKRPLFFPFLLSLLHDLTGYRATQGFVLNAGLLLAFLSLSYVIGRRFCPPYGGYLSVCLWATVPLLTINANSSGFDLLNLFMILYVGDRLAAYLCEPNDMRLNLLLLSAVLLAQTRYESVLFVLPVAFAVLYVWLRAREVRITKTMIVVPPMLIVFALQRRAVNEQEIFWQLPEGADHPFGFDFLGGNLEAAIHFFTHSNEGYPNSSLLTAFVFIAIVAFLYLFFKSSVRITPRFLLRGIGWLSVGLVVFVNFLILMAYYWGHLDDPVAVRLVLPVLLVEVLFVLAVAGKVLVRPRWQFAFGFVVLIYFFCVSRPLYARTDFFEWSIRSQQCDYLLQKCQALRMSERSLIISEISMVPVIAQTSSISASTALKHFDKLDLHMRLHTFDAVYVLYGVKTDGYNLEDSDLPGDDHLQEKLEERFELSTLDEVKINDSIYVRFARVEGVRMEPEQAYEIDGYDVDPEVGVDLLSLPQDLAEAYVESLPR